MKTKIVKKAPLCTKDEHVIIDPPYTIYGSPSLPQSQSIIMKVGGLRKMLDEFDLKGDDSLRIEWFADRATEYSFIKSDKHE